MSRAIFSISILAVIFLLEGVFPYFKERQARLKHAGPNIILSVINSLITGVLFSSMIFAASLASEKSGWGLFWQVSLSPAARIFFTFIVFDLWIYAWHFANHRFVFLWRLHRVHHNDPQMDVTTVLRFHPIEIILSSVVDMIVIFILGISILDLIIYKLIMQSVIAFHHSNIAIPEKWDMLLCRFIVTPNMHRIHHSRIWKETNSNYASVFSFWDRLFRTFRQRDDIWTIDFGLRLFMQKKWQTLPGLLLIPFRKQDN